ncbi:hypothetical protein ACFLTB_05330 [Chloroflexota bacterium]
MEKIELRNEKIDEELLMRTRKKWLSLWPTGKEVDFDEAVEYQKNLPDNRVWWKVMKKLREDGKMSVFPRAGTPVLEDMIELCQSLVAKGVVLVPLTSDSYSRSGAFDKAQQGLDESIRTGKTALNGFPIVNHGVKKTRKIIEACEAAFTARAMVSGIGAEIAIASGITSAVECGFPSPGRGRRGPGGGADFRMGCRLAGWYADRGVILDGNIHGLFRSSICPLGVNIVTMIVGALVSAEQGVKAMTPLVHLSGHMAQDLAWIRLTPRLIREYLDKYGYKDAFIAGTSPQHTPLFPVPTEAGGAYAFLTYTAMVAALSKSECVFLRTIDEGAGVATKEAHEMSYQAAMWIFDVVREQKIEFEMKDIDIEERVTEIEVRAIMDRLFELGDGDIVVGTLKGIDAGVIDEPWQRDPSFKGEVLGVRDAKGACRYLEFGNLPLPEEIKEFHREKISERERVEGIKVDYNTAVRDLWALSKGKIVGIPPYD